MPRRAAAVLAVLAVAGPRAHAGEDTLEVDMPRTALITGVGATAWVLSEVFKKQLAPEDCRWCGSNGLDDGVRDALVWDDREDAATASDILAFAAVPALAFGVEAAVAHEADELGNVPEDALVIAEAAALAMDLNQLVKLSAGRERPFVHALPDGAKGMTDKPEDNNLSFFSGHTAFTMSLAVSAGTVATMRGYEYAPAIFAIGVPLSLTAGYLRIAADKHYATDVTVGAVVGAAVGVAVPLLLHKKHGAEGVGMSGGVFGGGGVLALSGKF